MTILSNNLTNFYSFSQEGPGKLAIHFQDRLDVSNATLLIKEFNVLLRTHKPDNLVIDLERLICPPPKFIDLSTLRIYDTG